ncbi:ATP-binding cassette domain-containing protein [Streptacidiphilus sp. PB12-B1b]|nr:ATP-binding cassette domain-containing protein [Streptacidiphilus sp. PB12-B1b]
MTTVAPPDNDALWARALVKTHQGTPALRGVSLGVREGEVLAVTGPRGSGKSTLLDCLSGLSVPDEGEVWFNSSPVHPLGRAARERLRRERFGYVGPEPRLVPELTAAENVALPPLLAGATRREAATAASEWLERLDVADCARLRPCELRQEQRQRIAVARALVHGPSVVFADDPTAPLHRDARDQVMRILVAAARSHRITLVLATHDPAVARYADRVAAMTDGRLAPPVTSRQALAAAAAAAAPATAPRSAPRPQAAAPTAPAGQAVAGGAGAAAVGTPRATAAAPAGAARQSGDAPDAAAAAGAGGGASPVAEGPVPTAASTSPAAKSLEEDPDRCSPTSV